MATGIRKAWAVIAALACALAITLCVLPLAASADNFDEQKAQTQTEVNDTQEPASDDAAPDAEPADDAVAEQSDAEQAEQAEEPADETLATTEQEAEGSQTEAMADGTSMKVDLLFYKVAGYYNPSVSPSVYGGGTRVTIDDSTPVGFDQGQAFERLYDKQGDYVKVGHTVKTDRNFYTWTCIGFIPSQGDPSYGNWIRDHYLKEYCFESEDEATEFVRSNGGVLYGEVPSEDLLNTLDGYGNSASLIVVWTRVQPTLPENKYDYGDPIIDDATPVNWQGTTQGIQIEASTETVTESGAHQVNVITYTVTIPEGTNDDVLNIDLSEVPVPEMEALQPGDDVRHRVIVQDKSGHRYTYLDNSGSLGTVLNGSSDDLGIGFEKYNIPAPDPDTTMPGGWRIYGLALDELYQALEMSTGSNSMTDQRIGYALALAGYEYHEDDDLVKAYAESDDVDEAWEVFRNDLKLIERYYDGDLSVLRDEDRERATTVLSDLTKNRLDDYLLDWANDRYSKIEGAEGEGPWFTTFKDVPQNIMWDIMNGTFPAGKQVESNRSVVNAMYYGFYEYFYQASPSQDGEKTGVYTIMKEQVQANASDLPEGYDMSLATGNGFDDEFAEQWAAAGDDATEHELGWWHFIQGNANGNLMQDTFFFTSAQFKLVKPVVDASVTKVWDDADNKDGLRPASVTVELLINGEKSTYDALELSESTDWAGSWKSVNRYENNEEAQYSVNETNLPDGYEFSVEANTDEDGNLTATVTNKHVPSEPTPPSSETPASTTEESTSSDMPETGDSLPLMPLAAIGLASAAAFAAAYRKRLKGIER